MFNIGSGELLVILLVALIVLGPTKLPGAVRQTAKTLTELRKVSTGFQREMKAAMDDAIEADARDAGRQAVDGDGQRPTESAATDAARTDDSAGTDSTSTNDDSESPVGDTGSGTGDPKVSTAEAAGMYSIGVEPDASSPSGDDVDSDRTT